MGKSNQQPLRAEALQKGGGQLDKVKQRFALSASQKGGTREVTLFSDNGWL